MRVISEVNEPLYNTILESHKQVLKYCEKIEELYNVDIILYHLKGMIYRIEIKKKGNVLNIIDKRYDIPAQFKNYLKGLIDAHKIQIK